MDTVAEIMLDKMIQVMDETFWDRYEQEMDAVRKQTEGGGHRNRVGDVHST